MPETINASKNNVTVHADYDFGENLEAMRQKFGDEIVYSNARQQMKIGIQALMRRKIEKGENEAAIKQAVAEYVPGMAGERQDPVEKFKSRWASLPDGEREAILKELQKMQKAS